MTSCRPKPHPRHAQHQSTRFSRHHFVPAVHSLQTTIPCDSPASNDTLRPFLKRSCPGSGTPNTHAGGQITPVCDVLAPRHPMPTAVRFARLLGPICTTGGNWAARAINRGPACGRWLFLRQFSNAHIQPCDSHACLGRFARQGKIGRRVQIVVPPRAARGSFYDNFRTPDFTPFYAFLRPDQNPDVT